MKRFIDFLRIVGWHGVNLAGRQSRFFGTLLACLPLTVTAQGISNVCVTVEADAETGQAVGAVVAGQTYTYTASGCAANNLGCNGAPCDWEDPDGNIYTNLGCTALYTNNIPASAISICPGLIQYSLVGKINGTTCIQFGKAGTFTASVSGNLVWFFNDQHGGFSDNTGSWNACITATGTTPNPSPTTNGTCFLPTTQPAQHPYDITRTALFWFTHPEASNPACATLRQTIVTSGGDLKIGFLDLGTMHYWDNNNVLDAEDAVIEALSFYWKNANLTGEAHGSQNLKYPASILGHYRKLLARELIAAIANNALLGTFPTNAFYVSGGVTNYFPATLIEQAGQASCGTDPLAIQVTTALLHKFNGSGVTNNFFGDWLECSAWKTAESRKYSKDPTTQFNCPGLNDSCQTAKVIPGMPFSDTASLPSYDINSYTNTIPSSSCSSVTSNSTSTATNSVSGIANMAVWVLAPPVAAVHRSFTVQTRGSNVPALISVWSGTCDSLAPVTCVAGVSLFQPAQLSFTTDGVSTYYIAAQGNGVVGRVKIQITSP